MTFKYILISLLIGFGFYLLLLPRRTLLRKGFVLFFVSVMLLFAINPDLSTEIAHFVGVARGVDLLFYLAHLMLFFIAFVYYIKFKNMELRFTKLVRELALEAARQRSHTHRT
jgi:small membrane protein